MDNSSDKTPDSIVIKDGRYHPNASMTASRLRHYADEPAWEAVQADFRQGSCWFEPVQTCHALGALLLVYRMGCDLPSEHAKDAPLIVVIEVDEAHPMAHLSRDGKLRLVRDFAAWAFAPIGYGESTPCDEWSSLLSVRKRAKVSAVRLYGAACAIYPKKRYTERRHHDDCPARISTTADCACILATVIGLNIDDRLTATLEQMAREEASRADSNPQPEPDANEPCSVTFQVVEATTGGYDIYGVMHPPLGSAEPSMALGTFSIGRVDGGRSALLVCDSFHGLSCWNKRAELIVYDSVAHGACNFRCWVEVRGGRGFMVTGSGIGAVIGNLRGANDVADQEYSDYLRAMARGSGASDE